MLGGMLFVELWLNDIQCSHPYFAGAYECHAASEDAGEDPICMKCRFKEGHHAVEECKEHGADEMAYKCRFCCNLAVWFCHGQVHVSLNQ